MFNIFWLCKQLESMSYTCQAPCPIVAESVHFAFDGQLPGPNPFHVMFVPFRFGAVFGSIDLTKKIAHPLRWNSNTFRMFCVSKHVDWLQTNWPKQGRQPQLEKQLQHHRSAGPEVNSSTVKNIFDFECMVEGTEYHSIILWHFEPHM